MRSQQVTGHLYRLVPPLDMGVIDIDVAQGGMVAESSLEHGLLAMLGDDTADNKIAMMHA